MTDITNQTNIMEAKQYIMKMRPRYGKCNMCGECCKYLIIPTSKLKPMDIEFYEARGCEIIEEENFSWVKIPFKCPHLDENNKCKIYENRPLVCKEAPFEELEKLMPKKCGFKFREW